MKNKILALAVVATVAVAGAWNFGHSTNEMELSDVALANVEALASGETGTSCDAGGLGASSCTISTTYPGGSGSSKSVTCISGYYACCKKSSWGDLSASCVSY